MNSPTLRQDSYFDEDDVWKASNRDSPAERARIDETVAKIPAGVRSILDVGCGNGRFLNTIAATYKYSRLAGVDTTATAVSHVTVERSCASISDLPFSDDEFDLVTCLEVLEHIQHDQFQDSLASLSRVARSYVLISVPNCEDLQENQVRCPKCCCRFSPWHHVRSFTTETIKGLIPGFRLRDVDCVGPSKPRLVLKRIHQSITALTNLHKPMPKLTICPQCGFQQDKTDVAMTRWGSRFSRLFSWHRKPKWILALYEASP